MHILIVTNHFWPENFRINDLARGLHQRGHEVTVFTGIPDYPEGRFWRGYGLFRKRTEMHEGIKIVRFPLIPRGNGRAWNLVLNYASSALMSCLQIPFNCKDKYDAIFVFDTSPVTIGLSAVLLKRLKSIPIVFWVLDLWPESLSATGAVTSPKALGLVIRVVRFIYRHCDLILASSKVYEKSIQQVGGYDGEVVYLPNWVEPEYLNKSESGSKFVLPALPQGFRIMFAGNVGAAQDFPSILAAAEKLKGYPEIQWIIVGDGRRMKWVQSEIEKRDLDKCVHLLGRYPAEAMSTFFAEADAMLLTLRDDPIFAQTVPGKLQSYMACGKPIIAALNGEGARLVDEAGAGLSCAAETPDGLVAQVLTLYEMTEQERCSMGARGQSYCLKNFDREMLFNHVEKLLLSVAGHS